MALLAAATLAMVLVNVLLVLEMQLLMLSAMLIGCIFGCTWCLTPLIVDEQFGSESFGLNWSVVMIGSAIGGFVMNPLQVAVYNSHNHGGARRDDDSSHNCIGEGCFRLTFLGSSILAMVGFGIAVVLARKWRKPHQTL